MLITLVATAVVLGVLILVHELGHFWAAKLVDIEVPTFSIGLGPKMVGVQFGETEYVISWLPLGGYVRMAGMEEEEALEGLEGTGGGEDGGDAGEGGGTGGGAPREPSPRDFQAKPLWARTLVISAGVLMNFAFAVAAYAAVAALWGVSPDREARLGQVQADAVPAEARALADVPAGTPIDSVGNRAVSEWRDVVMALARAEPGPLTFHFAGREPVTIQVPEADSAREALLDGLSAHVELEPRIDRVVEGSPAEAAGLRAGDVVRAVDGRPVESWQDFVAAVEPRPGDRLILEVERDGRRVEASVVPERTVTVSGGDSVAVGRIGVASELRNRPVGPAAAAVHGARETWSMTVLVVEFVWDLVSGQVSGRELGGPIAIGQMSGEAARLGAPTLLGWMAFISINLAILNLLPIPVLDGGHLAFLAVEAVRGRPVSPERRIRWTKVGVMLVAALMVWVIVNDILRLVGG